MSTTAQFATEGTYTPDNLVAANAGLLHSRSVTILADQVLTRGAVLGKITSGGKYVLSLSTASDGSQTPDLILAQDIDATGADKTALAYSRGDFITQALTLGASHTAASITEGLRAKGINLFSAIA